MLKEKGFQSAEVTHEIKEMPGGPKLVNLTFNMNEGPKVKIREIEFVGNKAISDGTLQAADEGEQGRALVPRPFITGRGTYQETKFEEDAERVIEYYRDRGYIRAQVGEPELKVLGDSDDKKTRWVELRIPVTEGHRYRVGSFDVAGNTVVKTEALKPLFKLKTGEYYSEKRHPQGLREGAGGLRHRRLHGVHRLSRTTSSATTRTRPSPRRPRRSARPKRRRRRTPPDRRRDAADAGRASSTSSTASPSPATRRRATTSSGARCGSYENGVFNTEALKYSIRRLNQLGYFKALEGAGQGRQRRQDAERRRTRSTSG